MSFVKPTLSGTRFGRMTHIENRVFEKNQNGRRKNEKTVKIEIYKNRKSKRRYMGHSPETCTTEGVFGKTHILQIFFFISVFFHAHMMLDD